MPRDHDFNNGVIIFYIIYNKINVGNFDECLLYLFDSCQMFFCVFFWCAMDTIRILERINELIKHHDNIIKITQC